MKGIINFSLNNKFALWLMTIIVTVAGLYAGTNMKQETIPNLELPVLMVSTLYPGAGPDEVADKISKPLEQRLKNLEGVQTVSSQSMANNSSIIMEFDYDIDMDKALSNVRDAVSGYVKPTGAQETKVQRFSINAFPVVSLSISGENISLEEMTRLVEKEIKPTFEGVAGVSDVQMSGQYVKQVELKFNPDKLKQLGLSQDTVKGIIQASAMKMPLGLFQLDKSDKMVVVDGSITTLEDLKNVAIPVIPSAAATPGAGVPAGMPSGAGAPNAQMKPAAQAPALAPNTAIQLPTVKLQEVAEIELVGKAESISRTNGQESIGLNIVKGPDDNTVTVVNLVKEEAAKIEADHPNLKVTTMLDQGKPIEESVSTMLSKAAFGAGFAILIIMLFLRNIRTTLISVVSIPLSLLIAILLLNQMDITLNIMTLGAMTVAIGRVVDDSIVVVENNFRRMSLRSEKLRGKELVREATREMFMPITSSTLVTIAVFLPLGLVSGPIGEMFMPFALTMVFSLLASLLVAITVVPMMTHMMFRNGLSAGQVHEDKPGKLAGVYRKTLNWSLNHKLITFATAIVLLVGSLGLVKVIGVSFLPDQEDKYAMFTYTAAAGELKADVEAKAKQAEEKILGREDIINLQYSVGGSGNPMTFGQSSSALFFVQFESEIENFEQTKKDLIADLQPIGGEWKEMDMHGGGVGGSQLSLSVYGDSLEEIKVAVDKIQAVMKEDSNFEKVESSLSKAYDQYSLVVDQEKASKLGLTAGQVAQALSPIRQNPPLTNIQDNGVEYPVYIKLDETPFASIEDLKKAPITSPIGKSVAVGDVVKVEEGQTPDTITHKNGRLYVDVKANITAKDVGKASTDLQNKIDELELPPTVKVDFGGVTEQITETFTQLGLAMLAAIAIVYLLLVITFGRALVPFAILFSLPFITIGAFLGLWVAGETLSASAMMGALMLIGIVVTNAIVLLDRVIHMEREGLSTREALLEAAGTRLRPILMTALATIGALLPLALGFEGGNGGLISKGLGVTVIGGLASSTLLTLVIVPVVYEFFMKFRKKQSV